MIESFLISAEKSYSAVTSAPALASAAVRVVLFSVTPVGGVREISEIRFVPFTVNVLTGFKYIAEIVRMNEGKREFIGGGEESYGFNLGEFVRDKDAVISCCLVAEAAAWAAERGKSLYELLIDIYVEFGFYKESLLNWFSDGKI